MKMNKMEMKMNKINLKRSKFGENSRIQKVRHDSTISNIQHRTKKYFIPVIIREMPLHTGSDLKKLQKYPKRHEMRYSTMIKVLPLDFTLHNKTKQSTSSSTNLQATIVPI